MRGLDPRIYGPSWLPNEDVDARDKRGHDDWRLWSVQQSQPILLYRAAAGSARPSRYFAPDKRKWTLAVKPGMTGK
jgi:hypothetical protein